MRLRDVEELVEEYFASRVSTARVRALKKRIHELGEGERTEDTKVDADLVYMVLIDEYRTIKREIQAQLVKQQVAKPEVEPSEDHYGPTEYKKIIEQYQCREGEHVHKLFDCYAICIHDDDNELAKAIALESIISYMLRSQIPLKSFP